MSEIKTNQISSLTGSNSDITLDPDGTGNLIVASGKVGIGTTSPASDLHVVTSDYKAAQFEGPRPTLFFKETDGSADENYQIRLNGGDLLFQSQNDAQSNAVDRMTIDTSGNVLVGTTSADPITANVKGIVFEGALGSGKFSRENVACLDVNRKTSDGEVVRIYQDGTKEGTISVSGTTVSYNGGHLSRWSQATDGNRIDGLVKGTVMTNLDQMAEWTKDGVTEDNEQLNCMAVSSVEGDANVAGVFVNWDDDDEDYTADMNIAMTGDMVIRIASGTTVARGDLLMSAGDGTAKPQGDDIVRSKTIAKVTSTNVSHTYDDGSYLVPCVLMAC